MNMLEKAASEGKRVHFIGIGGIMMSALALELKRRGAVVTGNDIKHSDIVGKLIQLGIDVQIGHDEKYVVGSDIVVRNAAIKDQSPDIVKAKVLHIPILERPVVLGQIMSEYKHSIGISGMHGKSTTSAMLTHVFLESGLKPTAFLGAVLPEIGGTHILGNSDYFVAEACEYCESFLYLKPETAVILNVEPDHLDYYSGINEIITAFKKFAKNTPKNGRLVVNEDNKNAMKAIMDVKRDIITFGIESGNVRACDIALDGAGSSFLLKKENKLLGKVSLNIPGKHNVYNAVAAATVMITYGIDIENIINGLNSFTGIERRFQKIGTYRDALIVDDYAHHPHELGVTLEAARTMGYDRVICLFQPHTYSRTSALKDDFISVLKSADLAVLTDIYSARETNTFNISSSDIASSIPGAIYAPSLEEAIDVLQKIAQHGDIVLTCGAGSVSSVARRLVTKENTQNP